MKKLIALLFLGLISVSALGCSKEAAKPAEPAPAPGAPAPDTGTEAPAE